MRVPRSIGIFGAGVATAAVWFVILGGGVGTDAQLECQLAALRALPTDPDEARGCAELLATVKACEP